jgi:hypothetical protein
MPLPDYRWKVQLLVPTLPTSTWMDVLTEGGGPHRFIEKADAQAFLNRLQAIQPHVRYRVAPYAPMSHRR